MIYLDHNATTPLDEEVKEAMADAFRIFGNPSSSHRPGRDAKALIEDSRRQVADLIGAEPVEIIFTSGGTESNNLAVIGIAYKHRRGHVITSVIEHPSVLNPVKWLEHQGFEATYLPVDSNGQVCPDDIRRAVKKDTILITIMHSNNETGVLQPIQEIGRIARECNITFHSDAAQSVGKIAVRIPELMLDMLTIVSHKFYGPKGIGALYIKSQEISEPKTHIPYPIMFGAGHEMGVRPGTENTIAIAGLGKSCEIALRDMPLRYGHAVKLRDKLFSLLDSKLDIMLNGHRTMRLPNTLNISIKSAEKKEKAASIFSGDIIEELKERVAISAGSACHAGIRNPSPVLKAMGVSDADALSSIRLSVGKDNTEGEIESASELLACCVKGLVLI